SIGLARRMFMLALKDSCFDDIERLPTSASSCRNRAIVSGYRERVKWSGLSKKYKSVQSWRNDTNLSGITGGIEFVHMGKDAARHPDDTALLSDRQRVRAEVRT
ncbi:MAG: hypothetical protein ABJD68_16460, partial [Nakamurella sp.]